jgi:hypothetical protein
MSCHDLKRNIRRVNLKERDLKAWLLAIQGYTDIEIGRMIVPAGTKPFDRSSVSKILTRVEQRDGRHTGHGVVFGRRGSGATD